MILGLVGNPTKNELPRVLADYIRYLDKNGIEYLVSNEFVEFSSLMKMEKLSPEEIAEKADVLLSFGGDGTLLNTINILAGRETPVMGVNTGGLGYLTAAGPDELIEHTENLLAKKWNVERRMMLEISVEDQPELGTWHCLNDVIVDKGGYSRLISLYTTIDGEYLNNYSADGIIVSTPTGSTGYSLSEGGPIIEPKMAGILFVPINPHSLSNRPLLISDDKTFHIRAETPFEGGVFINVDGREACNLKSGCTIVIKRASFDACLVNFEGKYFYQVLRQKLRWGD